MLVNIYYKSNDTKEDGPGERLISRIPMSTDKIEDTYEYCKFSIYDNQDIYKELYNKIKDRKSMYAF